MKINEKEDNAITNLTELLLKCFCQPDPMLRMLDWLCTQLMEAEVEQQLGAKKASVQRDEMAIAVGTSCGG